MATCVFSPLMSSTCAPSFQLTSHLSRISSGLQVCTTFICMVLFRVTDLESFCPDPCQDWSIPVSSWLTLLASSTWLGRSICVAYRCVEGPLKSFVSLTNFAWQTPSHGSRGSCPIEAYTSDASPESQLSADLSPGSHPPVSNFTRPTLSLLNLVSSFSIVA